VLFILGICILPKRGGQRRGFAFLEQVVKKTDMQYQNLTPTLSSRRGSLVSSPKRGGVR